MQIMINGMKIIANSNVQKKVQARRSRKKRIDKKWWKRYGYKWVPDLTTAYVVDDPWYGKVLICHPKLVDKLEAAKHWKTDPRKATFHQGCRVVRC